MGWEERRSLLGDEVGGVAFGEAVVLPLRGDFGVGFVFGDDTGTDVAGGLILKAFVVELVVFAIGLISVLGFFEGDWNMSKESFCWNIEFGTPLFTDSSSEGRFRFRALGAGFMLMEKSKCARCSKKILKECL